MKRTVSVLLIILFALPFLAACSDKSEDVVGAWEGESNGLKACLEFNRDFTALVTIDDVSVEADWSVSEGKYLTVTLEISGVTQKLFDAVEYSVKGGKLTLIDNGEQAVFTRKK